MDQEYLYSIRMRATAGNQHISGAERIVPADKIDDTVRSLIVRARKKKCTPEQITIKIESLKNMPLRMLTALDVVTIETPDVISGRDAASGILRSLEISEQAAKTAIDHLSHGAAPSGGVMRGAMIVDADSGERLESDQEKGVRASRFDWTDGALSTITGKLAVRGLTHVRTLEALALASKVAHAPGMLAELCWSDEPDYTAGYVASRKTGYVRFPMLKAQGDPRGGRAFFVDRKTVDMSALLLYLQQEPVLINETGTCGHALDLEQYLKVNAVHHSK
jgi:6-carboxyhexanoate--CoA ligase